MQSGKEAAISKQTEGIGCKGSSVYDETLCMLDSVCGYLGNTVERATDKLYRVLEPLSTEDICTPPKDLGPIAEIHVELRTKINYIEDKLSELNSLISRVQL